MKSGKMYKKILLYSNGHSEDKPATNGAVDLSTPQQAETNKNICDVTKPTSDVMKQANCDVREVTMTPESTATCESGSYHLMSQQRFLGGTPTPEQLQQGFELENLLPERVKMPKG